MTLSATDDGMNVYPHGEVHSFFNADRKLELPVSGRLYGNLIVLKRLVTTFLRRYYHLNYVSDNSPKN